MTKHTRLANVLVWAIILLAALWLAFIAVPQFVDRISRHQDTWAREFGELPSLKLSDHD